MKRILIVHPHAGIANLMAAALNGVYSVVCTNNIEKAKQVYEDRVPDGMIVAAGVERFSDGLCWVRDLLTSEPHYEGKVVGLVDRPNSMDIYDQFTKLDCPTSDNVHGAVSQIQKALAA